MEYALIHTGEDAEKLTRSAVKALDSVTDNLRSQQSSIIIGNKLHTLGWNDSFRMMVEGLDECPQIYRNLVLNSAYIIHERCPLSVPLYLLTIRHLFASKNARKNDLLDITKKLIRMKKRISSEEVMRQWGKTIQDDMTKENFSHICSGVKMTGSLGTIDIKHGNFPELKTSNGISVSAALDINFSSRVGGILHLDDCQIVIVDGAVLDISKLNRVLTHANASKKNLAIFATKFSNDIINTLVVNWQNGKLKVVPMVFGQELKDVNQAADLAAITKTVFINKDAGNVVSEINEEDIREVKSITTDSSKARCEIIVDKSDVGSIFTLRAHIQEKFLNESVKDIKDILGARLSRLTSRKTILTIPCSTAEYGLLKDRTSSLFSFMKCCANEGVVEMKEIYSLINCDKIRFIPQSLPAGSVELSILKALSDFGQINKIGALILVDH